jgi:Acetyltransferase (GNAT) domain
MTESARVPRPTVPRLATDILTSFEDLSDLCSGWRALHGVASATNPFNQWTWGYHWWRIYGRTRGWLRDRLHIHIQRDESGILRAILPFVITSHGLGPLAVRKLRLFGSVPHGILTELPQMLIWPGYEEACATTLLETLRRDRSAYDWCELDGLPLEGPLAGWFVAQAAARGWSTRPVVPYYILSLPNSWDRLCTTLKPHIKKNIRNSHAALARDGHAWTVETIVNTSELESALSEFFRLHTARAMSTRGPRHPDHFASSSAREFLRSVALDLTAERRFMVIRLRIKNEVVATRLVLVTGGCFYLYHSGFDPVWWRYSVSTTLVAECIKLAITVGAHSVNLSAGKDASKLRWGPEERLVGGIRIVSPNVRSMSVAAIHDLKTSISQSFRARFNGSVE